MNKSAVFKLAHKITKATIQYGDNYQATFALCLKEAMKADFESQFLFSRPFCIAEMFSIVKCSKEAANGWKHTLSKDLGDGYYMIRYRKGNAHIVSGELKKAAEKENKPTQNNTFVSNYKKRTIVTLEYAQLMGLSHGKAWYCTELDVELKGACPSFEGQLICYHYE